jgi:Bacterial Ig domain
MLGYRPMALTLPARTAGVLAICLLMLGAPGAMAGTSYQPDALIRLGSGSYVGNSIFNTNALNQAVFNTGVIGQKLTFFILIENEGAFLDSFKVKRSGLFRTGYRVRYYDAANNDVTGQVNHGTFTTPSIGGLGAGDPYVMRATVKVRSLATPCSLVTRLMTVSSVGNPNVKDAVRFTAARATPGLNCAPVAVNDTNSITENAASVSGNLFANDIDPDGDPIVLGPVDLVPPFYMPTISTTASTGAYACFLDNGNAAVDALNNGQLLTAVFNYRVTDGNGGVSNTATLTITIHGVTD